MLFRSPNKIALSPPNESNYRSYVRNCTSNWLEAVSRSVAFPTSWTNPRISVEDVMLAPRPDMMSKTRTETTLSTVIKQPSVCCQLLTVLRDSTSSVSISQTVGDSIRSGATATWWNKRTQSNIFHVTCAMYVQSTVRTKLNFVAWCRWQN